MSTTPITAPLPAMGYVRGNMAYRVDVAPDATSLYIARDYGVLRVYPSTPAIDFSQAGDRICFEAGRTWVLDRTAPNQSKRHLETGHTLESFNYDATGRLAGVTGRSGNALVVERDAEARAAAIVAPDGQRSVLTHDDKNRLVLVEYAEGTDICSSMIMARS